MNFIEHRFRPLFNVAEMRSGRRGRARGRRGPDPAKKVRMRPGQAKRTDEQTIEDRTTVQRACICPYAYVTLRNSVMFNGKAGGIWEKAAAEDIRGRLHCNCERGQL